MPLRIRPFTVALAGGSGSGKTTLARELAARIGTDSAGKQRCAVLDHDSYYRDLAHLPPAERAVVNFDHPESLESGLLADHLAQLRLGRTVHRPAYDFTTHTRKPGTTAIEPRPVVLCEGILLLAAPELRHAFDLRVFIDVPPDVRVLRRLERDIISRGRNVHSVIEQYMTTVRPMHQQFVEPARSTADLVLGWRHTPAEWAATVEAALRGQMAERSSSA